MSTGRCSIFDEDVEEESESGDWVLHDCCLLNRFSRNDFYSFVCWWDGDLYERSNEMSKRERERERETYWTGWMKWKLMMPKDNIEKGRGKIYTYPGQDVMRVWNCDRSQDMNKMRRARRGNARKTQISGQKKEQFCSVSWEASFSLGSSCWMAWKRRDEEYQEVWRSWEDASKCPGKARKQGLSVLRCGGDHTELLSIFSSLEKEH